MVEYYIELVYSFYLIVKKANNFFKMEKKNTRTWAYSLSWPKNMDLSNSFSINVHLPCSSQNFFEFQD